MTENTIEPTEAPETAQAATTPATEATEPTSEVDIDELPTDIDAARKLRSEAKNLRTRLRDSEAATETLTGQLDAMRRQVIEAALDPAITPAAFWASGTTVESLLDESGAVDVAKVTEAAAVAVETFGLRRSPAPNPAQGSSSAGAPPEGNAWQNAFKKK